jgi:hypothetical protein
MVEKRTPSNHWVINVVDKNARQRLRCEIASAKAFNLSVLEFFYKLKHAV